MTKLTKQIINDSKVLVKIQGESRQEVLGEFWKFVNYGPAVKMRDCYFDEYDKGADIDDDTGFNWLNDYLYNEGYFRSDLASLTKTLTSISLFEILRQQDPECKLDIIPSEMENQAILLGKQKLKQMPDEDILNSVDKDINNN